MTKMTKEEKAHFIEWVFPKLTASDGTIKFYLKDEKKWLETKVLSWKKINAQFANVTVDKTEYISIKNSIMFQRKLYSSIKPATLKEKAKDWGNKSLTSFYKYAGISELSKPPMVRLGPSRSKGHYNPGKNIIWIDPRKNKTVRQKLDTLAFEAANASQREQLKAIHSSKTSDPEKKAWQAIKVEFKSGKQEIKGIIRRNKAQNVEDLVKAKNFIPEQIWKHYDNVRYSKTSRVKMSRSGLRDQKQRTALFWFAIRKWTEKNQINEYGYQPHTRGGKESTLEQEIKKYSRK